MRILVSAILCQCAISNFVGFTYASHALKFPDSDEQIDDRDEATKSTINAGTRTTSDGRNNTKPERESVEYSAAANACQKYLKEIPDQTFETGLEVQNEFPWMAAIGYVAEHQIKFQCNGVVISEYFVLTNVHCVETFYPPVIVRLGSSSISDAFAVDVPIKEIIRHPYHAKTHRKNDIALIRLALPIHFNFRTTIRPACLETDVNDIDPTIQLTQFGWERMHNEIQRPLKLHLQTMPLSQCNKTYLDYNKEKNLRYLRKGISKSQYCAYDPNYAEKSCGILSGASLQILPPNSSLPNIVGILSFGARIHCGEKQPEIFTRIAYYIPWIEAIVWPFDRRKVDVERRASNINTAHSTGDMSLISASRNGDDQTVSLLIQNGANVNEMSDGSTALHAAATTGQKKIAQLLIHNGADFTVKNKDGKTASEIANEKGFAELARVLQENVAQKACDTYSNLPFITTRVLGGESVFDTEFPWMAALGYVDSNLKVSFRCGGTLISEKFVLTAAHCCKDNSRPFIVRLGQVYLNNPEETKIIENHQIREIINHPDYSLFKKTNDIALIELVKPVYFSEFLRPACLQTYLTDENSNTELTVTGWGIVSPRYRNTSNELLKTNLKTVPLSECNSTVFDHAQSTNWTAFRSGIDQSYYCAADPSRVSDSCEGDSGGPLQIIRPHYDLSTVVGIVSTGLPCGTWKIPGIYTRVAHFVDWIESHVWPNGEIATPLINEAATYE